MKKKIYLAKWNLAGICNMKVGDRRGTFELGRTVYCYDNDAVMVNMIWRTPDGYVIRLESVRGDRDSHRCSPQGHYQYYYIEENSLSSGIILDNCIESEEAYMKIVADRWKNPIRLFKKWRFEGLEFPDTSIKFLADAASFLWGKIDYVYSQPIGIVGDACDETTDHYHVSNAEEVACLFRKEGKIYAYDVGNDVVIELALPKDTTIN